MNPRNRPSVLHRAHRSGGFTLIELMIAMILGLIVIAGVTSVFLAGQKSFRTNGALADVQDGSRIAFELMARDIREAGTNPCGTSNIANALNNGSSHWYSNWDDTVHGYSGTAGTVDPALAAGAGVGQRVANTDSVKLIDSDDILATVASSGAGTFAVNTPTTGTIAAGDLLMACSFTGNSAHGTIFQAGGFASPNLTFAAGGSAPGNCGVNLGFSVGCPSTNYIFPVNSPIAKLNAVDWYIGNNPAGGTSLYRLVVSNATDAAANGGLGGTPQEMVRNVTSLQLTYLQSGNNDFVTADHVTDWGAVSAVRATYTLQSTDQRATVDVKPIVRTYSAITSIRNRGQ